MSLMSLTSFDDYLRRAAVSRETIANFLDPSTPHWAQFDPETGYILGNSMPHDGLDHSWTISTVQRNGARTQLIYADKPCRINSYGNSFTQCHQVSDGETWQEYLAAHLGEPIRNFGMGGFGVYQSYRRMIRTERSNLGVPYVLFYLWGDDHCRSVMRCRHAVTYPYWDSLNGASFHGNFWAHVELDLSSGSFRECENLLPTPESLYHMTDPDFMVDALRDDLMLQLYALDVIDPSSLDLAPLHTLADALGEPRLDLSSRDSLRASALRLRNAYGFAASKFILEKTVQFCAAHNKSLLIILLCPLATMELLRGQPRYDQPIADFIAQHNWPCFDMNLVHLQDFAAFNLSVDDYIKRYFIGHYSPAGNHFFAYALKNTLVNMLDPKPITYRDDGTRPASFTGYIPTV